MKARSFKKFFVSIALSAILTFHPPLLFLQQLHSFHWQNSLQIRFRKTQILLLLMILMRKRSGFYLTSGSGIQQVAASVNSITVQWSSVSNADKYAVSISNFNSSSYRFLGYVGNTRNKVTINKLKAGTAYNIKLTALNSSGTAISSRTAGCTTLYTSVNIKSSYAAGNGYTFNMATVNPSNSISGYKVIYQSYASKKAVTKLLTPDIPLPCLCPELHFIR